MQKDVSLNVHTHASKSIVCVEQLDTYKTSFELTEAKRWAFIFQVELSQWQFTVLYLNVSRIHVPILNVVSINCASTCTNCSASENILFHTNIYLLRWLYVTQFLFPLARLTKQRSPTCVRTYICVHAFYNTEIRRICQAGCLDVTLHSSIWEIQASNLSQYTGYPDCFSWFPQYLHANDGIVLKCVEPCYATTARWADIPGRFSGDGSVNTFPKQ
jgi:hypothetical protein